MDDTTQSEENRRTSSMVAAEGSKSHLPLADAQAALLDGWEKDRNSQASLFQSSEVSAVQRAQDTQLEELKTTPLITAYALLATLGADTAKFRASTFPSYGLLAKRLEIRSHRAVEVSLLDKEADTPTQDERLFLNINAPWSTFICGSQGSGKSHTLSCILEDALLQNAGIGKLPNKLAAIVFHYDKFTGFSSSQICEAAYLCSKGIPVTVLVSPTNYWTMCKIYENLAGPGGVKPKVAPLLLEPEQLNVERMMKLMAMDNGGKGTPLYMEVVSRLLRSMAIEKKGTPGLDYELFKRRLSFEQLNRDQRSMVDLRLQLLENFMALASTPGTVFVPQLKPKFKNTVAGKNDEREWYNKQDGLRKASIAKRGIWSFPPGSLTIVDLSCPFVDESAACALFNMCLAIFLDDRQDVGRVVGLDEAHKFMSDSGDASTLTDTLLSVIRQQRHLATRVIIATQEPTISPKLLDLSTMTIVHRFTSPDWLKTLKDHLAGASAMNTDELFQTIVNLQAGQALLFSPSATIDVELSPDWQVHKVHKLGMGYIKIAVRKRLTADGGRSILAT